MNSQPSVSFTLKPKRVKFSDADSGETNKPNVDNADEPVTFTVCMKKPKTTGTEGASTTKANNEDYQSRIKELSQQLSKAKERIDILETKNKEIENMV